MPILKPVVGTFQALLTPVEVDANTLVRLSRWPASEPWWSKTGQCRFDDPFKSFGVSYVADKVETAFCDSVIHESGLFSGGLWVVAGLDLHTRSKMTYTMASKRILARVQV